MLGLNSGCANHNWSWAASQLLINSRGTKIERAWTCLVKSSRGLHFRILFFLSPRKVSDTFSVSSAVLFKSISHGICSFFGVSHRTLPLPLLLLLSSCRMEQRGMHPRQVAHQTVHAYGHPSFDNLQPPFYSGFPEPLRGGPKATRPLPPSYVQQHYVLDRDPLTEGQGSPPLSHRSSDKPQGYPSLRHPASPPQLQQPQPRQATVYTLFPQGHEAYHTARVFSTQMSRAPQQSTNMPLDPWAVAAFTENANTHLTEMEGGLPHIFESMYPSHEQPLSPLVTTHPPTYAQAIPPKGSPATTQNMDASPTSFPRDTEGNTTTENSPQSRSWGGAGSLDPTTGVFSRAADHPRIRTAQACEKCRARKAKVCSPSFIRDSQ